MGKRVSNVVISTQGKFILNMLDIINDISASDRSVGWMSLQIYKCTKEQKWYVALASLFMLTEQILRWASNADIKETLNHIISRASGEDLITKKEARVLHIVREYRNGYLHSDFHGFAFQIDGMIYPVNDEETAEAFFSVLGTPCFRVIRKLITSV